ncbi:MAG: hydroxymethylglutaryl-CoA lyase [Actinomycetota bacterium]
MMRFPERVRLVEVGPRDGLQAVAAAVPTEQKIGLVRRLAAAGCPEIEVSSFVRPDRVPQLADAEAVFAGLQDLTQPRLSALVPNSRGLERALASGVRRIAVFAAASESFSLRNLGMDRAASLRAFSEVAQQATAAGATMRGYLSTSFVCPFEGEVDVEQVLRMAVALLELGVDEVSLADTIGAAVPTDVYRRLEALLRELPAERLALHFHDTSGTALANVLAGLQMGITTFDSSVGGLGGCPFAPGAAGNLATEDLVYMLDRMGIETGVDLAGIAEASRFIEPCLGHPLPSRQLQRLRATE